MLSLLSFTISVSQSVSQSASQPTNQSHILHDILPSNDPVTIGIRAQACLVKPKASRSLIIVLAIRVEFGVVELSVAELCNDLFSEAAATLCHA